MSTPLQQNTAPPLASPDEEFQRAFGQPLATVLNPDAWERGADLSSLYMELEERVHRAVEMEEARRDHIRAEWIPKIVASPRAFSETGSHTPLLRH